MKSVNGSGKWLFGLLLSALVFSPVRAEDEGAFGVGKTLFNSGKYTDAMRYFQSAEADRSYDPSLYYYEALCHHRLGQIAAARADYQKVVDRFPDSDAAELAKKGLGVIDFGSGYDRPGGSLAKLDRLRMDIVPQDVQLQCQERDGKPVVDVMVDGRKISFLVDTTVVSTALGIDLVRSNRLNDISLTAKKAKAAAAKAAPKVVDTKATDAKAVDSKAAETKAAETKATDSKAVDTKAAETKAVETKGTDSKAADAKATDSKVVDTKVSEVKVVDTKAADSVKDTANDVVDTDANVILYDLNLGPIQRPSFPVMLSTAKPKIAVLGRDFLGPYKVTFNTTAKTLTMTRDHNWANPFDSGMALFKKGKYAQAAPLLKRASDNKPNDPRPLYCLASALQRSGNIEGAKAAYKQVCTRFPNSEAQYYSSSVLATLDPSFSAPGREAKNSATHGGDKRTVIPTFDVPFTRENNNLKVTAYIDGRPVEMYVDFVKPICTFNNTAQLAAIDPSYVADLQEVSRSIDESSGNLMITTVVRRGFLRNLKLGQAEKRHVPIEITDIGMARYEMVWGSPTGPVGPYRPLVPVLGFGEWRVDVMDDQKVLRFTRLPGR
ncbi:MAG: tetratricopeptide repeat protein [Cyanobacteria bacterium REEB67]|nr:tetratricopeptide repeat protein [Cyanobacteria bacterium REEB67]